MRTLGSERCARIGWPTGGMELPVASREDVSVAIEDKGEVACLPMLPISIATKCRWPLVRFQSRSWGTGSTAGGGEASQDPQRLFPFSRLFQRVLTQQPKVALQHPFWGDVSPYSPCAWSSSVGSQNMPDRRPQNAARPPRKVRPAATRTATKKTQEANFELY